MRGWFNPAEKESGSQGFDWLGYALLIAGLVVLAFVVAAIV